MYSLSPKFLAGDLLWFRLSYCNVKIWTKVTQGILEDYCFLRQNLFHRIASWIKHKIYWSIKICIFSLFRWTTDAEIINEISKSGVSDFQEIKFFENRMNGQSKGFCCVTVGSESSSRIVMEKLSKIELHGQTPVVTSASKSALTQFELQSNTRPPPQQQYSLPLLQHQHTPFGPMSMRPPRMPLAGMRPLMAVPRGPPRPHAGPMAFMGSVPKGQPPPHHVIAGPPPPMIRVPPPAHPFMMRPHIAPPPILLPRGPPPLVIRPTVPAPHVNSAFLGNVQQPVPPSACSSYVTTFHHGLSEMEFNDVMARNRIVSSSAIARAVQVNFSQFWVRVSKGVRF